MNPTNQWDILHPLSFNTKLRYVEPELSAQLKADPDQSQPCTPTSHLGAGQLTNLIIRISVDNQLYNSISSAYTKKCTKQGQKPVRPELHPLPYGSVPIMLEVTQPQEPRKGNTYRRETNRPGECEQVVEDGDGFGEYEGDSPQAESAPQPCSPVNYGILLKVASVTQDSDEQVLRCHVKIQAGGDDEPNESDSICDFLYCLTSASNRRRGDPLSTPPVYYKRETKVGRLYEGHTRRYRD
jgi:hypothetical protein